MTTAEDHLFGFLRALRAWGLPVPAAKQLDFFAGIETLAPSTVGRLYWIGAATLVTSEAGRHVYDEVFRQFFGSGTALGVEDSPSPDLSDEEIAGETDGASGDAVLEQGGGTGLVAGGLGPDAAARFAATGPDAHEVMRLIRREIPRAVPVTAYRRTRPGGRRRLVDIRAVQRESRRTYGEIMRLRWRRRPPRERRVLLLIDVSGSMKQYSADYLRFAHAMVATCERAEAFTFGTRLTRVTPSLRASEVDTALGALAQVVLDADGGTRIGPSLQTFLGSARFVTMARGALVLVLSDGLERGDCVPMADAVRRLSRLAHQVSWWSPLACDPAYRPLTRGMAAVRADLDSVIGVRDLETALTAVRGRFAHTRHTPGGIHV